jgi:hypothetical protein
VIGRRLPIRKYQIERAIFLALSAVAAFHAATWGAYLALFTSGLTWTVASISDRCAEGAAIALSRMRAARAQVDEPRLVEVIDLCLNQGRDLVECSGKLPRYSLAAQVGTTLLTCIAALVPASERLAALAARANAQLAALRGESPRAALTAGAFSLLGVAYTIAWSKLYRPRRWAAEARGTK